MKALRAAALAQAVEEAYEDALRAWRKENAPNVPLGDLFADVLHSVSIDLKIRPAATTWITVWVDARRKHESETYFYTVSRAPRGGEEPELPPNPLA